MKFHDDNLKDPRDVVDILTWQEVFDSMKEDIYEPDAVNIVLEHDYTTFNMLSQGTQTLAKTNGKDVLHCIAAGHGERISLVSPYQRIAIQAGYPTQFTHPETGVAEDINIPTNFSFRDLSSSKSSSD